MTEERRHREMPAQGSMKWLIVFPDGWISYAPSCLNFTKMLETHGQHCMVLRPTDDEFSNDGLGIRQETVTYSSVVLKALKRWPLEYLVKYYKIWKLFATARKLHRSYHFDRTVGIDEIGFMAAYLIDTSALYYSLEVTNTRLNKMIFSILKPRLLITQTKERGDYLCTDGQETVYLQNAPIADSHRKPTAKQKKGILLYLGNLSFEYGLDALFDSLRIMDETLYVKHIAHCETEYWDYLVDTYADLIESGRLILDSRYIDEESLVEFIHAFDIGFCFYDRELIERSFNHASSPSGKMFNYFAAGIPVIADDTIGFNPVREFDAGILLEATDAHSIARAVSEVRADYARYAGNARNAAEAYDYAKMFCANKEMIFGKDT